MTNEIQKEYSKFQDSMLLGRVTNVHKSRYILIEGEKTYTGKISGRFEYMAFQKSDYPVVGDYVIFKPSEYDNSAIIEKLCTRYSRVERQDVGSIKEKQILAANIDIIFICLSLNEDFNLTKLQNFITISYGSNASVVILLTKKDLCDDLDYYIEQVRKVNKDLKIISVSTFSNIDIVFLEKVIGKKTAVFIGSSGVGKSSLINKILGYEYLNTLDIRVSDAQGKHATTHREMVKLPSGGYIIDTPGIRVINSYIVDGVVDNFDEIAVLSEQCGFKNCTHLHEPNCKVREALDSGELNYEVFESYLKIIRLNEHNRRREISRARLQNKKKKR